MANRHYYGSNGAPIGMHWGKITTSWLVTVAYLLTVVGTGVLTSPADNASLLGIVGLFLAFLAWYALISLLALGVIVLGFVAMFRGIRGTGSRPWETAFWLDLLPAIMTACAVVWHIGEVIQPQ